MLAQIYRLEELLRGEEQRIDILQQLAYELMEGLAEQKNKNLVCQCELAKLKMMILKDEKEKK